MRPRQNSEDMFHDEIVHEMKDQQDKLVSVSRVVLCTYNNN